MPGVVVHAHVLAQLLDHRLYRELGPLQVQLLVTGLLLFGFALSWTLWTKASALGSQGLVTGALVAIDALTYSEFKLVLPFTLALWSWIIGVAGGRNLRTVWNWALHKGPK